MKKAYKIDRYSPRILAAVLLIILLSIIDAVLTLTLISRGAVEINPIMAYFLTHSPSTFFGVKYFLTCASLFLVLLNTDYFLFKTKVRVKFLLVILAIPFFLVVNWEVYLLLFPPLP